MTYEDNLIYYGKGNKESLESLIEEYLKESKVKPEEFVISNKYSEIYDPFSPGKSTFLKATGWPIATPHATDQEIDYPVVYDFGTAGEDQIALVGGKGAFLGEMTRLGLPVPAGFTIATIAAQVVTGGKFGRIKKQVYEGIQRIEEATGKRFGDPENPLLVSVRSGATVSMPGIMETILNVGLTKKMIEQLQNPFFDDLYYRLMTQVGKTIYKIDSFNPESRSYVDFRSRAWSTKEAIRAAEEYLIYYGKDLPSTPEGQLELAIKGVFNSWNDPKAKEYRAVEGIPETSQTAVNVQAMVFGNLGKKSLTTAFFTRDPSTGKKGLSGSFIKQEQGDALVGGDAGQPLSKLDRKTLKRFQKYAATLEKRFGDMQEIEMTVEEGKPYLLQTRRGRRTGRANVRISLDMLREGKITEEETLRRISRDDVKSLNRLTIDESKQLNIVGRGNGVSPGIAHGHLAYSLNQVQSYIAQGIKPILLKRKLETSDIKAIDLASGIATIDGQDNEVSHAIVLARGKNKPVIVGVNAEICSSHNVWHAAEGPVTIDADRGRLIKGHVPLIESKAGKEASELLALVNKHDATDLLLRITDIDELGGMDSHSGVIYVPSFSEGERRVLREAVMGHKESLDALRNKYLLEAEKIQEIPGKILPLVYGIMPLETIEGFTGNAGRSRFRERFLAHMAEREASLQGDVKKDLNKKLGIDDTTPLQIGSKVKYYGKNAEIVAMDSEGLQVQFPNGGSEYVKKTEFNRVSRLTNPGHFANRMKQEAKFFGARGKADPSKVYNMQREIAIRAAETRKHPAIVVDYTSNSSEVTIDGRTYLVSTVANALETKFARVKEKFK